MTLSRPFNLPRVLSAAALAWGVIVAAPSMAQAPATTPAPNAAPTAPAPGQVRVQGETLGPGITPQAPVLGKLTNYRDEMRKLIGNIANYARAQRPGFVVIPHNGMDLLQKVDDVDKKKIYPARAYMMSIDGIMQDALFYGYESFGKPTSKDQKELFKPLIEVAKRNRISMLTMDFTNNPKQVDEILAISSKQGYLPFVANKELSVLNALPTYPSRPFRENPNNILSMGDAKNYLYVGDSSAFGLETEFALKMHDNNYDLVIVDVFHGRKPLSKRAVETLKYKKLGARRLVLARMDIGTAATYRYYWQPGWQSGSPSWIAAPYPTDPDRFFVEYWRPEWHKMMYGDTKSFTYGLIAQGYDGVILETVEAFRYFESDGQDMAAFK